jgi:hypothetical protein
MSRRELFIEHGAGLVAVSPEETGFATFSTQGFDPFEGRAFSNRPGVVLNSCVVCHADSGIHSVQSRIQWMKPWQGTGGREADESGDPIAWETNATIARKEQRPEFLLLEKVWSGGRD